MMQLECWLYVGLSPLPVTVTTRIITFLVGDPYKPSFATVTGRGDNPSYMILAQHTPVSHTPGIPFHPQMKGIPKHKLLVGGLGYVPGVCWRIHRMILMRSFKTHGVSGAGNGRWHYANPLKGVLQPYFLVVSMSVCKYRRRVSISKVSHVVTQDLI